MHGRFAVAARRASEEAETVFCLGGFRLQHGSNFTYVHCAYDLQEFGDGPTSVSGGGGGDGAGGYKSGHSHVRTAMNYLNDTPVANQTTFEYQLAGPSPSSASSSSSRPGWAESPESARLPCPVGDAASAFFAGELWVVGGFRIQYDEELKLFYQQPRAETWVYSFAEERWRAGPPLPTEGKDGGGYTRGTAYVHGGRLFFSGGARLKVNSAGESNQIYEYVPNTKVFMLADPPGDAGAEGGSPSPCPSSWTLLLDLGYFWSKFRHADYSVLAVFPADITLTRLKVRRDTSSRDSKFLVKYLNINFPLKGGSGGDR